MLITPSHKEAQIKCTLRFHLTPRTPTATYVSKDTRKKEPSYTAGGNENQYNHFGEQYGGFLKTEHRSAI
jgi:hypothetical protein